MGVIPRLLVRLALTFLQPVGLQWWEVEFGVLVSPLRVVTTCCSVIWISVQDFPEQLRNGTGSVPVWFPEGCSVATTWLYGWFPLGCDVWHATFVFKVESLLVFFRRSWSIMVSVGCCQTTSGIGWSFDISFVSGLSHAAPEWRRGSFSLKFGLQLGQSHLSCFEQSSVGLVFVLPVVYSGEVVCLLHLLQGNISKVEWLVLPQVSRGGKTCLDLLSLWLFVLFVLVLFESLFLGSEFGWALLLLLLALFVLLRVWSFSRLSWRYWFW